jgi:urease accessory protein
MGEASVAASLRDSWRIVLGGRLAFADDTRLDIAGPALDCAAIGAGARAVATVFATAPNIDARLPDLRAAIERESDGVEAGASAFDGVIAARLISPSPGRLRAAVIASILALGAPKPPRLWQ